MKVPLAPGFIENYYRVIARPVWLIDVERRLNNGDYESPADFHGVSIALIGIPPERN